MPYTPIDEPDYQLQHTPRFSWETSCTEAVFIFDIVRCNLIFLNIDTDYVRYILIVYSVLVGGQPYLCAKDVYSE